MTAPLIISVSGLRGIVGESLTVDVALRYVDALVDELQSAGADGPIVLTRDGRANGPPLAEAIFAHLDRRGTTCLDGGVAATPTTGVLVRQTGAAGGVQVSASHNPAEYNGLKLFARTGRVVPAEFGMRVLRRYEQDAAQSTGRSIPGPPASKSERVDGYAVIAQHLELIAAACDVARIRSRRFRVVLDANHGSGSLLGRALLSHLGCNTIVLGDSPDGLFAHPPEPTEANLQAVLQRIVEAGADAGFCQDPDADRLAIIDERGRYLGEECTLALVADHVLRSGRRGPVVTNCSTSRMTEDLARRYGVPFFRSKVGEANVVDAMLAEGAVLGGEGNGGVIDPRVGLVRDSFVGMALALDAMAARGAPLSALAEELPQYAIHKSAIAVPQGAVEGALDKLAARFSDAIPSRLDGLRLDWPDGAWLLVRASNTEPIVRAVAEAPTLERARELCESAAGVISG